MMHFAEILQQPQHHFTRQNELSESATKISLAIAEELGTRQLPFTHGDFAKQVKYHAWQ
jgi:hypothetical protein